MGQYAPQPRGAVPGAGHQRDLPEGSRSDAQPGQQFLGGEVGFASHGFPPSTSTGRSMARPSRRRIHLKPATSRFRPRRTASV